MWEGVNWAGFGQSSKILKTPNYLGEEVEYTCDIDCVLTTDKSRISAVDGIIFEATHYGFDSLQTLPKNGKEVFQGYKCQLNIF